MAILTNDFEKRISMNLYSLLRKVDDKKTLLLNNNFTNLSKNTSFLEKKDKICKNNINNKKATDTTPNKIIYNKKIAVAVSGGSDSLSLVIALHMAKYNVLAILVNHNLRKSSCSEIKKTKQILSKFKIKSVVKNWDGNVKKNLESEARGARYNLLLEACIENDIDVLCVGHHVDDQIETFLLNLARGSGLDGLCAMPKILTFNYCYNCSNYRANSTDNICNDNKENYEYCCNKKKNYYNNGNNNKKYFNISVIRPMLDLTKQDCRDYLSSLNIKWCEDESNYDTKYKRNKIRFLLEQIEDKKLLTKRISNTINSLQEVRETLDLLIDRTMQKIISFDKKNISRLMIKYDDFLKLTKFLQKSVLTKCILTLSKRQYKLRLYQINNLLDNINSGEKFKRTIANCIIEIKQEKTTSTKLILISKEIKTFNGK